MARSSFKVRAGRLLLDLLLLVALGYMGKLILGPAMHSARVESDLKLVIVEAHELYSALERFYDTHRAYPGTELQPKFAVDSIDPLRKRGYYRGWVTTRLVAGRLDAYESPDDQGQNREFWLEMSLRSDPAVRLLVAKSDDAPLGGGRWLDGVYLYRRGKLEQL